MKYKKHYRIDRSKWRCGGDIYKGEDISVNQRGLGTTALLNDEGFMCCLGQTCRAEGVHIGDLLGIGEPYETDLLIENFTEKVDESYPWSFEDTPLASDAIKINDNEHLSQKERESKLKELFKKHNLKLTFYGRAVLPTKVKHKEI